MKLFDHFVAVRFPEEDLIFVTNNRYLYYIYDPKYKHWRKHKHAGYDTITVKNYQEVSKEEIMACMNGSFPTKETDFMRLCPPNQLCIRDMFDIFTEDYGKYMEDYGIHHVIHAFLLNADDVKLCHRAYQKIRDVLDEALAVKKTHSEVLSEIKQNCYDFLGRDIFKKEIDIVDGHDGSSFFWIMPARVIDYSNSDSLDNVAEMRSLEISIEEDDVNQYLTPFLYKYFDDELPENKYRADGVWKDDNGKMQYNYITGFEWNLTYNYFSFEHIANIIEDVRDTVDALSTGRETIYTKELRKKRGFATDAEMELIIDFYNRFVYRMEYMLKIGAEKGYNLISFMGP